jgi:predicted dehydrogenase
MAGAIVTQTDQEIQRYVQFGLRWDTRVSPNEIGVAVKDGEASVSAMVAPEVLRADVEIFGPGGGAALDRTRASGSHVYRTMYQEFADAIDSGGVPALDARHGLHLQRLIESADTDVLLGP